MIRYDRDIASTAMIVAFVSALLLVEAPWLGNVWAQRQSDVAGARPSLVIAGGGLESDSAIGKIRSITVDARGNIFVADESASEVLVFDSTGRRIQKLGRKGRGPGEFMQLYSVAIVEGQLAALDPGNSRIQFFDSAGKPVRTVPWLPLTGSSMIVRFFPAGPGVFVRGYRAGQDGLTNFFVQVHADRLGDTIVFATPRLDGSAVFCNIPGGFTSFEIPFARQHIISPAPGRGLAAAISDRYEVTFLSSTGDTLEGMVERRPSTRVSDADWRERTKAFRDFRSESPGATCRPADMPRPRSWPALVGIYFDNAGRMFIETAKPSRSSWSVYDPRLRRIATFETGLREPRVPPFFLGQSAYIVVQDADGVQSVHRYEWAR